MLNDKNGVYDLAHVSAITVTNDKAETAVLHLSGGQVLITAIPMADAVKAFIASRAPAAAEPAAAAPPA